MAAEVEYRDYHNWVQTESAKHRGLRIVANGYQAAVYLPEYALQEYWDHDRVRLFLQSPDRTRWLSDLTSEVVIDSYLRIFATLAYISTPDCLWIRYLDDFEQKSRNDHQLSFSTEELRLIFPATGDGERALAQFHQDQFVFSPKQIDESSSLGARPKLNGATLHEDCVIALKFVGWLGDRGEDSHTAQLALCELPGSSSSKTQQKHVVAKIFPSDETDFSYKSERSAYRALNRLAGGNSQYFLSCYGSFRQCDRGVILLEHADRGSLLEFFERNEPPHSFSEMIDFWTSLVDVLRGLGEFHNLHQGLERHDGGADFSGVHQDVQPSNILVLAEGDDSVHKFRFKIGDFGLSSVQPKGAKTDMLDKKGSRIYTAPELMEWDLKLSHLQNSVSAEVDMWSIGCVLLEAAVWSVCGERGRLEFLADRKQETQAGPPNCRGTFHNGERVLGALPAMITKLGSRRRIYDQLTMKISEWLYSHLIVFHQRHRSNAQQAVYHLDAMIQRAAVDDPERRPRREPPPPPVVSSMSLDTPTIQVHPANNWTTDLAPPFQPASIYHDRFPARHSQVSPYPANVNQPRVSRWEPPGNFNHNRADPNTRRPDVSVWPAPDHSPPTHLPPIGGPPWAAAGPARASPSSSEAPRHPAHHSSSPLESPVSPQWQGAVDPGSTYVGRVAEPHNMIIHEPRSPVQTTQAPSPEIGAPGVPAQSPPIIREDAPQDPRPSHSSSHTSRNPPSTPKGTTVIDIVRRRDRARSTLPADLQDIPNTLSGRDQIFLIDNSGSMENHWSEVYETMTGITEIVKRIDPDGMEVRFTSAPSRKSLKLKHVAQIETLLGQNKPKKDGSKCLMEQALNVLFADLQPSSGNSSGGGGRGSRLSSMFGLGSAAATNKTGTSIYILTNGIWGGDWTSTIHRGSISSSGASPSPVSASASKPPMAGVDGAVETLVRRLRHNNAHRTSVTLHFVRFGHDPLGKRRLRYLDNEMKQETGWDIVDRRYYLKPVRRILLGPLDEAEDIESDDSDDEGGAVISVGSSPR